MYAQKKNQTNDKKSMQSGLVCLDSEQKLDYQRAYYCSKHIALIDGECIVLQDVKNFLFNSRYYNGGNTKMIKDISSHAAAVSTSKYLASQGSQRMQDIASSIQKLHGGHFIMDMREFLKKFGDFWVKKDYKDNNIDIFAEDCFKSYGLNLVDIQY